MADTNLYATITYVEPARLKCANANCSRMGEQRNRIDGAQLLAQASSGVHLWVRLYFCDECYTRYKAALDRLALIAEGPTVPPNWHIQDGCNCDVCTLARAIRGEQENADRGPEYKLTFSQPPVQGDNTNPDWRQHDRATCRCIQCTLVRNYEPYKGPMYGA